ncbi:MAG: glycosyltransferase family 39 protein [Isosphaeraceae bacterium]
MLDLGFVALLTLGAWGVGRRLLQGAGLAGRGPIDQAAMAIPLGMGWLAMGLFGLGQAGWLNPVAIGALILPGIIEGCRSVRIRRVSYRPGGVPGGLMDAVLVCSLLGTLLTAMAPVTDGDALAYHLQLPRKFLDLGSIAFDPYLHESAYPMVVELLYACGLAVRGPVSCRLIQWVLGICLGAGVTALARPSLGDRSRWAGTVAMLVPAISNGMGAPLNDVALAAFGVSALVALMAFLDHPQAGGAWIAGMLAGLAIGVKYPALLWTAMLLGLLLLAVARGRAKWAHLGVYLAASILIGGAWYLRAWWFTGNPVYPFFRSVFGGSGIDEVLLPGRRPLGLAPWKLLTAIVPMTLNPSRFESRWHQIGPMFLLFLPLLVVSKPPRRVWLLCGLGYLFFSACLTLRQSPRFSLTALGPMSVGVAWVISWASRRPGWLGGWILGLALMILAGESAWSVYRARHGLGVLVGRESADRYLSRREPTYRIGRWIDARLPASARLIGQEPRGFYLARDYTSERRHRLKTGVGKPGQDPAWILESYRSEGFTHLLLCPPIPESAAYFDPALSRALESWLPGRVPILDETITDPEGITRRYSIYDLDDPDIGLASRPTGVLR